MPRERTPADLDKIIKGSNRERQREEERSPSWPTPRFYFRLRLREPFLRLADRITQGTVPFTLDSYDHKELRNAVPELARSFHELAGLHLGDVPPSLKEGIRRGGLETALSTIALPYWDQLYRNVAKDLLGRIGVKGRVFYEQSAPGTVTANEKKIREMNFGELISTINHVQEQCKTSRRLKATGVRGVFEYNPNAPGAGVLINKDGIIDAQDSNKRVFLNPVLHLDLGNYAEGDEAELLVNAVSNAKFQNILYEYWRSSRLSLEYVLRKRARPFQKMLAKELNPFFLKENYPDPHKVNEVAVKLGNMFALDREKIDRIVRNIYKNLSKDQIDLLEDSVDRLQKIDRVHPFWYFKPASTIATGELDQEEARKLVLISLLSEDLSDPEKVVGNLIEKRLIQQDAETRTVFLSRIINTIRSVPVIRLAIGPPTDAEVKAMQELGLFPRHEKMSKGNAKELAAAIQKDRKKVN